MPQKHDQLIQSTAPLQKRGAVLFDGRVSGQKLLASKWWFVGRGLLFTLDSGLIAGLLSAAINPLAGRLLEQGYWFYRYHYTITPVLLMIPIFVLLGYGIPAIMYRHAAKQSVVERLREAET